MVDGGFVFIVPKSLRAGKKETACLSLHGDKSNKKADISVNIKTLEFAKENSVLTKKSFDAGTPTKYTKFFRKDININVNYFVYRKCRLF